MKIRTALTATVLAAALTTLSACGGTAKTGGTPEPGGAGASVTAAADSGGGDQTSADDQSADDQMTDDESADDQTTDDETADDSTADQGGVDQPSADDDTGSAGAADPGAADFCKQLIAAEKQLDSIDQAFGSGDVASASKTLTADMQVFQKLAAAAPSEIAPAMQDIITALTAAQKALSGGGAPDPSAMAGLGNMTGDLTALGNYIGNNCAAYAN